MTRIHAGSVSFLRQEHYSHVESPPKDRKGLARHICSQQCKISSSSVQERHRSEYAAPTGLACILGAQDYSYTAPAVLQARTRRFVLVRAAIPAYNRPREPILPVDLWPTSLAQYILFGPRSVKLAPTFSELSERWISNPLACAGRFGCWCSRRIRSLYTACPAVFSGTVFGLVMPLLGLYFVELGGMHTLVGHPWESSDPSTRIAVWLRCLLCVPFGWTMLVGWLSHSLGCGYSLTALMLVSLGCALFVFWLVSRFSEWVRSHGATARVVAYGLASATLGGYVLTGVVGGNSVREAIRQDCITTQTLAHMLWRDEVPQEPIAPEIYYCFPVVPGLLVSERCFVYGPMMGIGGRDLWVWDGKGATTVYMYGMWRH